MDIKLIALTILIIFLISFPAITYAESYRVGGIYEMTTPDDWRVVPGSYAAEQIKIATEIAKKTKTSIDLKGIGTPLQIYKEKSNGVYLVRVIVGSSELSKEEFEKFTPLQINKLGEELSKRQNEAAKNAGIRLISSQFGTGTFKGTSAFRTESVSINSKGFKVSRIQYIVYRTPATLMISLEHTALSGEPNYKLIENEISSFNVLAQ